MANVVNFYLEEASSDNCLFPTERLVCRVEKVIAELRKMDADEPEIQMQLVFLRQKSTQSPVTKHIHKTMIADDGETVKEILSEWAKEYGLRPDDVKRFRADGTEIVKGQQPIQEKLAEHKQKMREKYQGSPDWDDENDRFRGETNPAPNFDLSDDSGVPDPPEAPEVEMEQRAERKLAAKANPDKVRKEIHAVDAAKEAALQQAYAAGITPSVRQLSDTEPEPVVGVPIVRRMGDIRELTYTVRSMRIVGSDCIEHTATAKTTVINGDRLKDILHNLASHQRDLVEDELNDHAIIVAERQNAEYIAAEGG